jgi:glycosyltransferase involved in cell wall biosynthesis
MLRGVALAAKCDAVLVVNATLRALPTWAFFRGKVLMQHHTTYEMPQPLSRAQALRERVRRTWIQRTPGVSVSPWVHSNLPAQTQVILNPAPLPFRSTNTVRTKDLDLLFAGRIVKEKGLDTLLEALSILAKSGVVLPLTVMGDGDQRHALQNLSRRLCVSEQITWLGELSRNDGARLMTRAQYVIIPSEYESYGMVAIEALTYGASLIMSDAGNLGALFAPYGISFRAGDPSDLARVLLCAAKGQMPRVQSPEMLLAGTSPEIVAQKYIEVMAGLSRGRQHATL